MQYLVFFHVVGILTPEWAVILPAPDPWAAILEVKRRYGREMTCSAMPFPKPTRA